MLRICHTAICLCTLLALLGLPLWALAPGAVSAEQTASCQELLINGDFEAGPAGWTQSSAGSYDLISQFNPRAGQWGAYLAGANNADDQLSQPLALPADAISVTLRLWWSLESEEPPVAADTLTLSLLQPNGALLAELWSVDNTAALGIWDDAVIDLTAYAGQSVTMHFQALSDDFDLTDFYLDDISVTACAQATTPRYTLLPLIIRQR